MGNENSFFKRCTIQSQPYHKVKNWSLHSCAYELKQLNLFVLNNDDYCFDITTWKSIRHPFILKYYDSGLYQGKKAIVTEPVDPIANHTSSLTTDEIICGLNNICEALSFIHETCMISHNCITMDSIFMSPSNYAWKLGCLQLSTSFGSETRDKLDSLLIYLKSVGDDCVPPEDTKTMNIITTSEELHRRDSYALGKIFEHLLAHRGIELSENIKNLKSKDPSRRPKISSILKDPLFTECDYLNITSVLVKFATLSETEKELFLHDLVNKMRKLPPSLVASKLIPLILTTRFVLLHPLSNEIILPYLFICTPSDLFPEPLINEDLFKSFIMPVIFKLYLVHNIQVRLILLHHLPYYISFISQDNLRSIILPQIKLGMDDENDELVAASFQSFSHLVTFFGAKKILGARKKLFNSVMPKLNVLHSDDCSFEMPIPNTSVKPDSRQTTDSDARPIPEGKIDPTANHDPVIIMQNNQASSPPQLPSSSPSSSSSSSNSLPSSSVKSSISSYSFQEKPKATRVNRNNSNFDFVDIKTIDFKPINGEEVDLLFSDMEPKLKFGKANHVPVKTSTKSSKFDIQEVEEISNGWNEESWETEETI